MGLFDKLFGKKNATAAPNPIRETLFGDMPLDQWPAANRGQGSPWTKFIDARTKLDEGRVDEAVAAWREIVDEEGLETRHTLQAWNALRLHGEKPPADVAKQVLGVVVEVGMPNGLDLLAAYADHTGRYWNYTGSGVVWDHPNDSLDALMDSLLADAQRVALQIGPWEQARPPAPVSGNVRISMLTPSGIHFGEGAINVLYADPLGGAVFQSATNLMQAMIAKSGH
jgi:hypothetical protein